MTTLTTAERVALLAVLTALACTPLAFASGDAGWSSYAETSVVEMPVFGR